jgi:hypothetical protein
MKVEAERQRYNLTATDPDKVIIPGCTKVMRKSMGLPCAHVIQQRLTQGVSLQPADFKKQWRPDRTKQLPNLTILDLLCDPQQIPSRSTKKKKGKSIAPREDSAFEIQRKRQSTVPGPGRGGSQASQRRAGIRSRIETDPDRNADEILDEVEIDYNRLRGNRPLQALSTARPPTNTTGKSKRKAIIISDDETDELAHTTAQAEERRPPPKISDLLEYSSETEEDSEDSLGRDDSDSDDLPDAEDYEMIDFRGKNVPLRAKDKAAEVDEVAPVRKRRRFEDYLDE